MNLEIQRNRCVDRSSLLSEQIKRIGFIDKTIGDCFGYIVIFVFIQPSVVPTLYIYACLFKMYR